MNQNINVLLRFLSLLKGEREVTYPQSAKGING